MTTYDLRAQATAARNLKPIGRGGKGQTVQIAQPGEITRNPDTGKVSKPGGPTETGSGIELAYSVKEIDGATILRGDKKFMLSPFRYNDGDGDGVLLTPPQVGWTFTYGSTTWRVMAVDALSLAGNVAFTYVQLRAGG